MERIASRTFNLLHCPVWDLVHCWYLIVYAMKLYWLKGEERTRAWGTSVMVVSSQEICVFEDELILRILLLCEEEIT